MEKALEFDPIWEEKYARGHAQRYPWDMVVSFVFRYARKDRRREEIDIMEVGCGAGANLWFAAREGFRVSGLDASASAIAYALRRFSEEGLTGDLRVGSFSKLPFADESFDLVIDREAITCVGRSTAERTVGEIHRTLRPGGKFLFNAYSSQHTSASSGKKGPDGVVLDISSGTLVGFGQLCFYDREDVAHLFRTGWEILTLEHLEIVNHAISPLSRHAEWRVIAVKRESRDG